MADEIKFGAATTAEILPDAIRPGAPGTAKDVVPLTRPTDAKFSLKKADPKHAELKDSFREVIETIVFVVVLVLMLKTFLAEAFVLPAGSMATTLLGYHKDVTCSECGHEFRVNCSNEVEPQQGRGREDVLTAHCPNCFLSNSLMPFRQVPQLPHGDEK